MLGFYPWPQLDLCSPYFDKFYNFLPDLLTSNQFTPDYIKTFFHLMLPRMLIEDKHIEMLGKIKEEIGDSRWRRMLEDGVQRLRRSKGAREKAVELGGGFDAEVEDRRG